MSEVRHDAYSCAGSWRQANTRLRQLRRNINLRDYASGVIDFSLRNKFIVLLATMALMLAGIFALRNIPLDAIPDLSDTQVIIYTEWPGPGAANCPGPGHLSDHDENAFRSPREGGARLFVLRLFVRLCHFRGRHRSILGAQPRARISQRARPQPAKNVTPSLGPDATGVGWAFMYSINSKDRDLAELRSMQDWYLKYQLTSVEGVAEVASVGGFVKQYQVTVDPARLRAYNLSIAEVSMAVKRSNGEVGGRSIEMAEKEFILRVRGYIQSLDDLRKVRLASGKRRADPARRGRQRPTRPRYAPRHRRAERRRRNGRRALWWCATAPTPARSFGDVKKRWTRP